MSSPLKFRAWDKDRQQMFDVDVINFVTRTVEGVSQYKSITQLPFDGVILRRPTGLKDKNGKEIYEGDIVEQLDLQRYPELGDKSRQTVEVKFNPTAGYNIWPADCEVIGNIYENPDLLKGEPNE